MVYPYPVVFHPYGLYIQLEDQAVRGKVFTEDGFRQFSLNLYLHWTCDEAKKREGGNMRVTRHNNWVCELLLF